MPRKAVAATRRESKKVPAARTGVAARSKASVKPPAARSSGATAVPRVTAPAEPVRPAPPLRAARAEQDINALLDSLNRQMTAALSAFTELAVAHRGPHEAVVRTKPIDRATATFQRLISEVVDERLAEMLPPLVHLRNEIAARAEQSAACAPAAGSAGEDDWGSPELEYLQRWLAALDQVLAAAEVQAYDARVGESFDPLIHLAVGESCRADLPAGVVAEMLGRGFRTARGKVVVPARVRVNRR